MRKTVSAVMVVLLVLVLGAQAAFAAPLVPVSVGGKAATTQSDWEISEITFASGVDDEGAPVGADVRFPVGTPTVYAIFDFAGLGPDDLLTAVWYQEDEEALVQEFTLEEIYNSRNIPDDGTIWFFADFSQAAAGNYAVELYVNDDFAVDGIFVVLAEDELIEDQPMVGGAGNVISIYQEVPVIISIPHPDDPDQIISVPVTLTIDLLISLGSNPEVTIEVGEASPIETFGDLTEEQVDYVLTVADYMAAYGESLTVLGGLLSEAGEDESLLEDDGWLEEVYLELDFLLALNDEVRALEAPEGFEDVQTEMVTATDHFEEGVFLLDDGIQNVDEEAFLAAVDEFELAGEALQQASELIGAMIPDDMDLGDGSSSFDHNLLMSIMDNFPSGSF